MALSCLLAGLCVLVVQYQQICNILFTLGPNKLLLDYTGSSMVADPTIVCPISFTDWSISHVFLTAHIFYIYKN